MKTGLTLPSPGPAAPAGFPDAQAKIEGLTERVIRLEATLELLMRAGGETKKKLPRS